MPDVPELVEKERVHAREGAPGSALLSPSSALEGWAEARAWGNRRACPSSWPLAASLPIAGAPAVLQGQGLAAILLQSRGYFPGGIVQVKDLGTSVRVVLSLAQGQARSVH